MWLALRSVKFIIIIIIIIIIITIIIKLGTWKLENLRISNTLFR